MKKKISKLPFYGAALLTLPAFLNGCAEQPYGYIFTPQHRDQSNAARQAADFISAIYDHVDVAAGLLESAGLTSDYRSILSDGWVDITPRDGNGVPLDTTFHFYRNYLDKQLFQLEIDRNPTPGALRTPSHLRYNYFSAASLQNSITRELYGTVDEVRQSEIQYAGNLQNLRAVDGWCFVSRMVPFDSEIEIQAQGQSQNVTITDYLPVGWSIRLKNFSIDKNDQSGTVIIDGNFPVLDEERQRQRCHVSGEFKINANGSGGGDLWLYGEPCARLTFTGRSFGFKGKYSLFSEDLKRNYNL